MNILKTIPNYDGIPMTKFGYCMYLGQHLNIITKKNNIHQWLDAKLSSIADAMELCLFCIMPLI